MILLGYCVYSLKKEKYYFYFKIISLYLFEMITSQAVIVVCILLLLAYIIDISAKHTKIPSVILLLALGFGVGRLTQWLYIPVADLEPILPVLGTIGLILIVLEGALDLELNNSKFPAIRLALVNALLPILLLAAIITTMFMFFWQLPLRVALVNAIPFCVISSAIAIPSVRGLSVFQREFVIFETSLSDIIGVLFFNFILYNEVIDGHAFGHFGLQMLLIIVISFLAVLCLSFLMAKLSHHVTYTPILILIILIYYVSKIYHLPGLIFILVFGLFLGNLDEIKKFRWVEKFNPAKLDAEVHKFKSITLEATFIVRVLFFMVFGFLLKPEEIINLQTLPFAAGIVGLILLIRYVSLRISRLPIQPLLFIAPRGLITILLFISITGKLTSSHVTSAMIVQTVLLSVIIMMLGLMFYEPVEQNVGTVTNKEARPNAHEAHE